MRNTARPHSVLVPHKRIDNPSTAGELLWGYAEGCMACQERANEHEGEPMDREDAGESDG